MADIPHCNELFLRYFDRWYQEADRQSRAGKTMPRPDLLTCAEYVGSTPATTSPLTAEFQAEALRRIEVMTQAAQSDWASALNLKGDMDLTWVEAVDNHYDTDRIAEIIACSDPEDFGNEYVVTCCEFGALLGHVMINLRPRLFWSPDWPYWESSLIDPASGSVIPVFHWGIKKMSSYGWDDLFAQKVQACLEMLDEEREG